MVIIRKICCYIFCCLILSGLGPVAFAASPTPPPDADKNYRSREQVQERQQEQQQNVFLEQAQSGPEGTSLPAESPAFTIHTLVLQGDGADKFPWAQQMLDQYRGRKIGLKGIKLIVERLDNAFNSRGYITTSVSIPDQDISSGIIKLTVIPGRVHAIRFAPNSMIIDWQTVLPVRPGDILNIHQLDQGLEQIKSLPSQDAKIAIVPVDNAGQDDIVLTITKTDTPPDRLDLAADDSGNDATGKIQLYSTFSTDNLLGLGDYLAVSRNGDDARQGWQDGTEGSSFVFSIPDGDKTIWLSSSSSRFHEDFWDYYGEETISQININQLLYRDQASKTYLTYGIVTNHSHNYLNYYPIFNNYEVTVQSEDSTALTLGLSHYHNFGNAILSADISEKHGVNWLGAQSYDYTNLFNIWVMDAGLTLPADVGPLRGLYTMSFHDQYTKDALPGPELLSIGNRYTVRGFDGQNNLSGDCGWYLQNEVDVPIGSAGLIAYAGLDAGGVHGAYKEGTTGNYLVGSVVGFKNEGNKFHYDFFVGWPLRKPSSFTTGAQTYGFEINYLM